MTVIELLIYAANGFLYFLMAVGILTLFFPIKMSVTPPVGILLGVAVTSNTWNSHDEVDINYVFFQIHLVFFALGVFINLGEKQ